MAKKKPFTLTVKTGKGVMSKDGKTPWAARTMHFSSNGWKCPMDYSIKNIFAALQDQNVSEIQIIDENNVQYLVKINRSN